MIAEAAAGSMMDEERCVGAADVHIAAYERVDPLSTSQACKETQLRASRAELPQPQNEIPHNSHNLSTLTAFRASF